MLVLLQEPLVQTRDPPSVIQAAKDLATSYLDKNPNSLDGLASELIKDSLAQDSMQIGDTERGPMPQPVLDSIILENNVVLLKYLLGFCDYKCLVSNGNHYLQRAL